MMKSSIFFLYFFCFWLGLYSQEVQPYDILINEFLPDPTPSVGLPNSEFIELYNRSDKTLNLLDYRFVNGTVSTILPAFILKPKQYVIIYTQKSTVNFSLFGDTLTVPKLITLSNPGDTFYLASPKGVIIDVATYDLSFYQNPKKKDGGWSLERTNSLAPCFTEIWIASENLTGGTPGKRNSITKDSLDTAPPQLRNTYFKDANTVVLTFNKSLDRAASKSQFEWLNPLTISSLSIKQPDFKTLELNVNATFQKGVRYSLILKNTLRDCQGFALKKNDTVVVQLPEKIEPRDLVINELLFNPEPNGARFLEIVNRSQKVVDVHNLKIADAKIGDVISLTSHFILFPKQYAVITNDVIYTQKRYRAQAFGRFFIKNKLPTWNDKNGNAAIYTVEGSKTVMIDSFDYKSAMHSPLLAVTEGVSLERVRPDRPTNESANWHSAAESAAYATPGYQNSQYRDSTIADADSKRIFKLSTPAFSPDDDGFQDFINIEYGTLSAGFTATIRVFDSNGRFIKTLTTNQLLATEGVIKWSGETDAGTKAPIGLYIIHCQLTSPGGIITIEKLTAGLTKAF